MDRDDNGIPDWAEDENYLDEAPGGRRAAGGFFGGCLVPMLLAAVLVVWLLIHTLA